MTGWRAPVTADEVQALSQLLGAAYDEAFSRRAVSDILSVGVELEFLLENADGSDFMPSSDGAGVVQHIASDLGLEVTNRLPDGTVIAARDPISGDTLCYEYTFGTIEWSLAPSSSLRSLHQRGDRLIQKTRASLASFGLVLSDRASSASRWAHDFPVVPTLHYKAVQRHLAEHCVAPSLDARRFTAFTASCQTHIDANPSTAACLIDVLNDLAFVRASLFANSRFLPGGREGRTYVERDRLWQQSAFGMFPANVYMPPRRHGTMEGLLRYECGRSIYHVVRGGQYLVFPPQPLIGLLRRQTVDAVTPQGEPVLVELGPQDIVHSRNYADAVLTRFGTVEVRNDCQQPSGTWFGPAAFNLGIASNLSAAQALINQFMSDGEARSYRQMAVVQPYAHPIRKGWRAIDVIRRALDVASEGLRRRGQDEAYLLDELYERLERQRNPALDSHTLV